MYLNAQNLIIKGWMPVNALQQSSHAGRCRDVIAIPLNLILGASEHGQLTPNVHGNDCTGHQVDITELQKNLPLFLLGSEELIQSGIQLFFQIVSHGSFHDFGFLTRLALALFQETSCFQPIQDLRG